MILDFIISLSIFRLNNSLDLCHNFYFCCELANIFFGKKVCMFVLSNILNYEFLFYIKNPGLGYYIMV